MTVTMLPSKQFLRAAVMGWPISHSRSPLMHSYWLEQQGLAGAYIPIEIKPGALGPALRALHPLGFAGCNLTIPHKQDAMAIVDEVDDVAKKIGAISCVVVRKDGSLFGTNNDWRGFIDNVKQEQPGWRANAGPITVVGAGGGGRAEDAAMLVNVTNQGMVGQEALDIRLDKLSESTLVSDIIYTPLETPFLADARGRGNRTINGLGMLLHQGPVAWKLWFDRLPTVTAELRERLERSLTGA
jgi:shikimate dehydrogenase